MPWSDEPETLDWPPEAASLPPITAERLSLDDRALVTAAEAARMLGVSDGTIRSWKARAQLVPAHVDERGRALYSLRTMAEAEYHLREYGSIQPGLLDAM